MADSADRPFVSRAGQKLDAALRHFQLDVRGCVCADLGSHVGGFVDCLLSRGADRVYSVDTSYGTLAWKLRKDPRVFVMERSNAMHVALPELVDLVTIDVGWTPQAKVLANVALMLKPDGRVISLVKPHYEAAKELLVGGVLREADVPSVVAWVLAEACDKGWRVDGTLTSPILGRGGNTEVLAMLSRESQR